MSVSHDEPRPIVPVMRFALLLGTLLVTLAGIQLYLLTRSTDHWFAWTIAVPLTAAFLGGFYFASAPLAFFSERRRVWVDARVPVPGVLAFLWLTLLTTLLHLSKFHLHASDAVARGAAWLWLAVYAADPPFVTIALLAQLRARGSDPPRATPLPVALRGAVGIHGVVMVGVGAMLFAAPAWVARWWAWPLTPLTARAMASWLTGLGIVLLTAFAENDVQRVRITMATYVVLGVLQVVALARFASDLRGGVAEVLVVIFWATAIAIGFGGMVARERPIEPAPA